MLFCVYDSPDRYFHIAVARCLAAPRRAVDEHLPVFDAENRVVVIDQLRSRNIVQPKSAVRAFSCSARAQEKVRFTVNADDRGVYHQCAVM